ncbi:MAG TPA: hypothetical protein VKT29_17215 [Terriglobales bacterium]|nr:hypothetical protein [Terriglobales bacterium]
MTTLMLARRESTRAGVLGCALKELGLEPLDPLRVSVYRADRRQAAEARARKEVALYWNIPGTVAVARWMAVPLEKTQVPDDVLADARRIQEKVPAVELWVDELHTYKRVDPFLVVRYRDQLTGNLETYYVRVWDEGL